MTTHGLTTQKYSNLLNKFLGLLTQKSFLTPPCAFCISVVVNTSWINATCDNQSIYFSIYGNAQLKITCNINSQLFDRLSTGEWKINKIMILHIETYFKAAIIVMTTTIHTAFHAIVTDNCAFIITIPCFILRGLVGNILVCLVVLIFLRLGRIFSAPITGRRRWV